MKLIKVLSLILTIIMVLSFAACSKSDNADSDNSSDIETKEVIQYDFTPTKPEVVVSATADHTPEKGYDYTKEPETNIVPTDENTTAEGFLLTTTDETTKEVKNIVSVYNEQGDYNVLEIDILAEGATDADLDAAVKLTTELIESSFENISIDEIAKHIPLTTSKIKEVIKNNEQTSETVYGTDTNISITYDYYPQGTNFIYRIEY